MHVASRGTYGALRVLAELTLGRGIVVGHNAVAMLMRRAELLGRPGKRRRRFAPQVATAADLVERDFARQGPDEMWVTDITEHPTREGKLYCCVVLDCFSRRVVGWSLQGTRGGSVRERERGCAMWAAGPLSLGGVPDKVVCDNDSAIVAERRGGVAVLHDEVASFFGQLGTKVVPLRPGDPQAKGQVERTNGNFDRSFLSLRTFSDLGDLQAQHDDWAATIAFARHHRRVGAIVHDVWRAERTFLTGWLIRGTKS